MLSYGSQYGPAGQNQPFSMGIGNFGVVPPVPSPGAPIGTGTMPAAQVVAQSAASDGPGFGQDNSLWGKIGGIEGLQSLAQGLASLGQVYGALQGVKLAKKQFSFTKQAYNTNLKNQTQSYNTSLEDRIRSRYATEGRDASAAEDYLSKHSL